ncbi:MAG: Superoxide dismutase 2 precursor [Gemmatimonadetes bacterium]|nr:Superoxide dismutase 2 precursor [Gemmatimonadota bacterium]
MSSRSIFVLAALCVAACSKSTVRSLPSPSPTNPAPAPAANTTPAAMAQATAVLRDVAGTRVGTATFTDTYTGVLVTANITGLGLGAHGIHIHEVGKCEPPFASAGGHFNPEHRQHGFLNPNGSHLGDMPNVDTPAAGQLRFEFLLPGVTLKGTNALLDADGASIVMHSGRDDYTTDPSGNSGARIGCGVIVAK